jgi:hypothetical protein
MPALGPSTDLGAFNKEFRIRPVNGHRQLVGPLPKSARVGHGWPLTSSTLRLAAAPPYSSHVSETSITPLKSGGRPFTLLLLTA